MCGFILVLFAKAVDRILRCLTQKLIFGPFGLPLPRLVRDIVCCLSHLPVRVRLSVLVLHTSATNILALHGLSCPQLQSYPCVYGCNKALGDKKPSIALSERAVPECLRVLMPPTTLSS